MSGREDRVSGRDDRVSGRDMENTHLFAFYSLYFFYFFIFFFFFLSSLSFSLCRSLKSLGQNLL